MKLRVPEDAAGERVDRYVASLPEVGSRAEAERLLSALRARSITTVRTDVLFATAHRPLV